MEELMDDRYSKVPPGAEWCPECNGYGSSLFEETERCTRCGGSGLVMVADPLKKGRIDAARWSTTSSPSPTRLKRRRRARRSCFDQVDGDQGRQDGTRTHRQAPMGMA